MTVAPIEKVDAPYSDSNDVDHRSSTDSLLHNPERDAIDLEAPPRQDRRENRNGPVRFLKEALRWSPVALATISTILCAVLSSQLYSLQTRIQELEDNSVVATPTFPSIFKALYDPLLPVDAPIFTNPEGIVLSVNHGAEDMVWTQNLGSRVLVLNMDSRPFNESNQILHDGRVAWNDFDGLSAGMLSHYSYALLHGYDYKFIRIPSPEDRAASWAKPGVIASLLRTNQYDFVIFMDDDCIFHHLQLPIEWLLNHWNITTETSLSMPIDPNERKNLDPFGRLSHNSGFIIAQNLPRTIEILDAWSSCPDSGVFVGCSKWKDLWTNEQAAFSEYIRYAFNETDDVKDLPCDEANGYPESRTECHGLLVRHYWISKQLLRGGVAETVMNKAVESLRSTFLQNQDDLVIEWESFEGR